MDGWLLLTHPDLNKSVLCRSLGAGRDGEASLEDAAAGHSSAPYPSPGVSPAPCSVTVSHPEQKQEKEILCL